ncbi:tRNA-splicing endonuclease subunit sen54 N-term-domain-containing protein [Epithele typhae]|uniref:tRNA-splicing endonuclease subunit sen54 N-term-domain-containing protein n=1 Tax=Epithele typhae TaxID=378194 RepID=UPI0020082C5F|nr:tRNA-splicing endonuclease subunit sen54 N-term-domain-containing protein [Epithele typhae]KAH9912847.1 tRNA-splicing endonuclease subunit sen54 N-term-domain-containing protein [Epithele typhae]
MNVDEYALRTTSPMDAASIETYSNGRHTEFPSSAPKPVPSQEKEEDEQSESESGDEDQGPDWTKIPGLAASRPVIPKRGEKDFEPSAQGGSNLQKHVLDRSRGAMLDALKATRTISHKSVSHAIWYPQLKRAHVTVSRGILFASIGHSAARATAGPDGTVKSQKRLELLPEEALYLVERGAMYCWRPTDLPLPQTPLLDDMEGVPMSVQQAYAEMIGIEDLTFEKYQVYAYLKRLGYVSSSHLSIFARIYNALASFLGRPIVRNRNWWRPLGSVSWLHHGLAHNTLFKSMRFFPSGSSAPLHVKKPADSLSSPYQIFFNLYKPSTPFKKTAPPQPDFSVVVVNARTTPVPSLTELTDLFGELPVLPPPVPQKAAAAASHQPQKAPPEPTALTSIDPPQSFASRAWTWVWPWSAQSPAKPPTRNPNPFPLLKTGNKMVVIAVVDAGTISFFRFGQGVFSEWPMA